DEALDVVEVGAEGVLCAEGAVHGDGAAALDVRAVGGEVRREDEDGVAGVEERLAEELLEDLGAGGGGDVRGADGDAELALVVARHRLAEGGQPVGGTVVTVAALDGVDAGVDGGAGAGEGAVADLQLDDVLALRLEAFGDGEDVEGGLGDEAA